MMPNFLDIYPDEGNPPFLSIEIDSTGLAKRMMSKRRFKRWRGKMRKAMRHDR